MKVVYTTANIINWNWTYFILHCLTLTLEDRVQYHGSPCGICCKRMGKEKLLSPIPTRSLIDVSPTLLNVLCRTSRRYFAIHFGYKMLNQHVRISSFISLHKPFSVSKLWKCENYEVCWPRERKLLFYYAGKAIPLQALAGSEGSRRLRLPEFKTIGTWRWQGCQPYTPAAFTPRYSFLLEAESTPGP
jgi:hypothetical protein